jgi:hypothetical protein
LSFGATLPRAMQERRHFRAQQESLSPYSSVIAVALIGHVVMVSPNVAESPTSDWFGVAHFKQLRVRSREAQEGTHPMVTRRRTLRMSQNAVLGTTELLEAILQNMTIRDLLRSRCVRRTWNALILHSPRLRRALFLDAEQGLKRLCDHRTVLDTSTGTWRLTDDEHCNNDGQEWSETRPSGLPRVLNTLVFCTGRETSRCVCSHAAANNVSLCISFDHRTWSSLSSSSNFAGA